MSIEPTVVVSAASTSGGEPLVAVVKAYIGPGAGLGAVGALLALVGAALLMAIGFVWYPVKRLMTQRRKAARAPKENTVAKS